MRDSKFKMEDGILNRGPTKGTYCVQYINENYFD